MPPKGTRDSAPANSQENQPETELPAAEVVGPPVGEKAADVDSAAAPWGQRMPEADAAAPATETLVAEPAPVSVPAPAAKTSGFGRFLGLLAGGVIAAGAGFGLATYGAQQGWPLVTPQTTPPASADELAGLGAEVARLSAALAAEQTRAASIVDLSGMESRLGALETGGGAADPALAGRLDALEERLNNLPPADPGGQVRAEIETQLAIRMEEARTASEDLRAEAEALRKSAEDRAALLALRGAFDLGDGFAPALAAAEARGLTAPEALKTFAGAPVTLAELRASFPEAARAALAAARAAGQTEGTMGARLSSFLMQHTGARSLAPREGSDPDAVLSRIEAALAAGDLAAALALVAELPPTAQEAMAPWTARAQSHSAAEAALAQFVPAE